MRVVYSVTPEMRLKLKEPIGELIQGSFAQTMKTLKYIIAKENPSCLITVGDTVSRNVSNSGFYLKLSIVDNISMRRRVQPVLLKGNRTIQTKNPQATITDEAIKAVQQALGSPDRVKILVEGEEDLLALIAILHAPENSYVIYGQPHEGIVVVKVTKQKRQEVSMILKAMETGSKS
jgi:uncharacterized protein (UPF0218 family)